ncbi:MAG: hypothetical protein A3K90_03640 [Pelodictyon luteolum]|uniref:Uncharacterized protein n=1 Tax=Pelodictyon luteolum TaxID=1100 RepID=A0A165LDL9_PELLU|nr:hypothetical protein [Pelodictyon luteolum]KZK73892.1 MAG: hypothetical protein A3K90_03640 [Pelodictyon luteolum]
MDDFQTAVHHGEVTGYAALFHRLLASYDDTRSRTQQVQSGMRLCGQNSGRTYCQTEITGKRMSMIEVFTEKELCGDYALVTG